MNSRQRKNPHLATPPIEVAVRRTVVEMGRAGLTHDRNWPGVRQFRWSVAADKQHAPGTLLAQFDDEPQGDA